MHPDDVAKAGPDAVAQLLASRGVTAATRAALAARIAWSEPPALLALEPAAFKILKAVCDRLIPGDAGVSVDVASRLDQRLAEGGGDGWRYDALPEDKIAIGMAVAGVEETARALFEAGFCDLPAARQDDVLAAVQEGSPPGEIWRTLNARLVFTELWAEVAAIYYSQPGAQLHLGYAGMADAEGFYALGLGQRDPIENELLYAKV